MKLFVFVSLVFLIQSCTTLTPTIPLSDEFKSNSKIVTLKAPFWRIRDSVFNMPIDKYRSSNTELSWVKTSEELTNKRREGGGVLDWLLFDDTGVIIKEFNVDRSQRFSFYILSGETLVSKTNCGIFSQSLKEENTTIDKDNRLTNNFDKRKRSFLSCIIKHRDKKWELALESNMNEPLSASLRTNNDEITLKEISGLIYLDESGEALSSAPSWFSQRSGLSFHYQDNQISAISFGDKSTFWVENDLAISKEELIFTANYALTLFNWVDGEWN